ncbi:MAG: phage holin family protein [Solirubrobacterales bacterium]|nr:phage holin family protein [Solirubrobacterales bacterium]MBV9049321.1 phage holin family protein [Solirubrobacterales bacterium]MBV9167914.1 phage holin family protein [Solirubrobacterales bacterium]MBV9535083.1 phage holin family protein [Solirubrobacterales bacterium]
MAEIQERGVQRSVPELVREITAQSSALAHKELELAEAELAVKAKRAGRGAGMFGGAGVLSVFGLGALTAAAILGLALVVAAWAAALIVGGVYLAMAGVAALLGRAQVRRATPLAPADAAASVRDDLEWIKAHAKRGRQ